MMTSENEKVVFTLNTYAHQRAELLSEIHAEVLRLGGDPEKTGTFSGRLHQGSLNIKKALAGQDETAVVDEAERGEEASGRLRPGEIDRAAASCRRS